MISADIKTDIKQQEISGNPRPSKAKGTVSKVSYNISLKHLLKT